eukprot:TRINITY_DN35064_c2_g1_i1.p1 TRINITY_DN35064_c2_g1~~TRINITY_DN35064_c2_g1_i1.p1  ORF type:complete len:331 (-),score=44.87 TRINITY_DN35064_c2_g1_i1:37-1029(-)
MPGFKQHGKAFSCFSASSPVVVLECQETTRSSRNDSWIKGEVVGFELDAAASASCLRQKLLSLESAGEAKSMASLTPPPGLPPPGDFRKFGHVGDRGCSRRAINAAFELDASASASAFDSELFSQESALDLTPRALPSSHGLFFTNLRDFGDLGLSLTTTKNGLNSDLEGLAACFGEEIFPGDFPSESKATASMLQPGPWQTRHLAEMKPLGMRYKATYDSSESQHPSDSLCFQKSSADLSRPLQHVRPTQDPLPVLSTTLIHAPPCLDAMHFGEVPSVGSHGHPLNCNEPCKYSGKPKGCKDGKHCSRCHLCRWTRKRNKLEHGRVISL